MSSKNKYKIRHEYIEDYLNEKCFCNIFKLTSTGIDISPILGRVY